MNSSQWHHCSMSINGQMRQQTRKSVYPEPCYPTFNTPRSWDEKLPEGSLELFHDITGNSLFTSVQLWIHHEVSVFLCVDRWTSSVCSQWRFSTTSLEWTLCWGFLVCSRSVIHPVLLHQMFALIFSFPLRRFWVSCRCSSSCTHWLFSLSVHGFLWVQRQNGSCDEESVHLQVRARDKAETCHIKHQLSVWCWSTELRKRLKHQPQQHTTVWKSKANDHM